MMRRVWLACMLVAGAAAMWAQGDPPSRVARLNFLEGSVSFQAAGQDDWAAATPNYPLTVGDHLWADENSHAEMHVGSTAIRLDAHTALAFLNLDDRMVQLKLSDGTINISVRHMESDESYEIDTPNGAITLLRPGRYRIDADPDRQVATVTVRVGDAEVTAGGTAFPVHARQSAYITGTDAPTTEVREAAQIDNFDRWWQDRDGRVDRRPPPRYVSSEMNGYEDLDDYGSWRDNPGYGAVWYPRTVVAGWAPYHFGHWVWIDPWGWTWVDDAPWGFAPFHYGRWAYVGGAWGWVPGEMVVRPVYAPALVAWVGGGNWGVSLGFGGGVGVGWFPLGPREPFIPAYRVSNTYISRVNVVNVTNVTNITNVTNVNYANRNVPGAVTAVSRTDFVASRPVARVAVVVPASAVASAQISTRMVPVAREQAVAARPAAATVAVSRPPQAALAARVVTKTPPPAATMSLARPTNVPQPYRPATANRPPAGQAQPQNQPPYRPPAAQTQPQNQPLNRPPAAQAQPQNQPAYRPPAAQTQPQNQPANRPPAAQTQPQNQPPYRPPAGQGQARPQSEPPAAQPHTHGAPPPPAQNSRPQKAPPKPEKESKPKNER